ncbi:MAG: DUF1572 family protein [Gemmatimonadetes bacterium]|nr:DUF1572 family protein [Gemmatimonadota bacterium]
MNEPAARDTADALGEAYLRDLRLRFANVKTTSERAAAQVDAEHFFTPLDPDGNSIALLMKHMAGNLESRFTDFLTTDGEKPTRDRDAEFVREPGDTRASILARWDRGWAALETALASLRPTDLLRTVYIRAEPHTVLQALSRQLAHQAMHSGQIVMLARHYAGAEWRTLSVPRGGSAAYTAALVARYRAQPGPAPELDPGREPA